MLSFEVKVSLSIPQAHGQHAARCTEQVLMSSGDHIAQPCDLRLCGLSHHCPCQRLCRLMDRIYWPSLVAK